MENPPYMEAVVAPRATKVDLQAALEGTAMLSLETQAAEMGESDVLAYIEGNFPDFLRNIRYLSREDRELLLGYYALAKTQTTVAPDNANAVLDQHQAGDADARDLYMLGPPTAESMKPIFEKVGVRESAHGTAQQNRRALRPSALLCACSRSARLVAA